MEPRHDRLLYEKDGKLHFGCDNPFCCHGNPGLPNHFTIPLETDELTMRLVSHDRGERVKIEFTPKVATETHEKGVPFEMECEDNFLAMGKAFEKLEE